MNMKLARGLWPVMLTPFTQNNAIDYTALDALIEWYIENDSAGLFAICQSSEMDYLTTTEKKNLLEHILQRVDNRIAVVAAGLPMDDSEDYAAFCQDIGVAALVIVPNRLVEENQDETACWDALQVLLDKIGDIDLGLYECPQPYHRTLSPAFVERCAHTNRFVFMKETSCNRNVLKQKIIACENTRLQIYPAHGPSVLFGLENGASGCSNIAANVVPNLYAQLCQDPNQGLQDFLSLIDPLIRTAYPESAKRWLQCHGLPITDHCRTPTLPLRADDEGQLFNALEQALSKNEHQFQDTLLSVENTK